MSDPEVLRALAGAPTADVAALREAAGDAVRAYEDGYGTKDEIIALRDVLAAAPEGAPTADVAECPTPMHHPLTVCRTCHPQAREGVLAALRPRLGLPPDADQADVLTAAEQLVEMRQRAHTVRDATRKTYGISNELDYILAAAPEGVDAADERGRCATPMHHPLTICPICHPNSPAADYDQPTLAERDEREQAVGEMADELTAAQAAIQRVRELCTDHAELDHSRGWTVSAGAILGALDGGIAEEER